MFIFPNIFTNVKSKSAADGLAHRGINYTESTDTFMRSVTSSSTVWLFWILLNAKWKENLLYCRIGTGMIGVLRYFKFFSYFSFLVSYFAFRYFTLILWDDIV